MVESISYTPEEVAQILKISRFTVYEMIKRGDLAAYRIGRKMRVEAPDLDTYIQRKKGPSLTISQEVNATSVSQDSFIICGQDVLLDVLTRHLNREMPQVRFLRNNIGSIDGLSALYRGQAHAAATHLWDSDTDSYNAPYVRHLLPGHRTLIINLACRAQGFYVAKGNPKQITCWHDLSKSGIRLINRELGSGTRVLLDEQLRSLSLDGQSINGYSHEELSHLAVASCVARGDADVGLGVEKAALQVAGVDFIPLQQERFDLVIRREDAARLPFQLLIHVLKSTAFRKELEGIGGYDLTRLGETVAET